MAAKVKKGKKAVVAKKEVEELFDEECECGCDDQLTLKEIAESVMMFNMDVMGDDKVKLTDRLVASANILKAVEVIDGINFDEEMIAAE